MVYHDDVSEAGPNEKDEMSTYFPVRGSKSPPSERGISRLSPAPEAALPYITSEPGSLFRTPSSTPDSAAGVGD
jgi:hypothetical protein